MSLTPTVQRPAFDGRIAVIMPSFNHARFLERALCSVLDQHDHNLEIRVVDGGSEDETLDLLAAYNGQLASWTTAWDSGPAEAINHGLARCRADLIVVLSANDVLLPGALLELRRAAAQHPHAPWFVGDTQAFDAHDRPLADAPQTRTFATTHRPLNHPGDALLDPAGPPPLSACALRQSTLELMAGVDATLRHVAGADLILRLLDQGFTPQRVATPFAGIRDTDMALLTHPQAHGLGPWVRPVAPSPADILHRQREVLQLLECFADRLPPAARFALSQEAAERRHLLTVTAAHAKSPAGPLWLAALRDPWQLADPAYRRALLAGQPAAALEQSARRAA